MNRQLRMPLTDTRVSGKPGVCIATSGPGATNLVTGIATANLDSVPMVAITGQVATTVIGTDAFQEADIMGATIPLVKHSMQVRTPEQIPTAIKKHFTSPPLVGRDLS